MPLEGIYLFALLLGSMGLLAVTGIAALWLGRRSERWAVAAGAGGALAACAAGLAMAGATMVLRFDQTLSRPWNMPAGEFRLGLDPLSAFFLVPLYLLTGLAAVYAIGYFRPWRGRNPGRFWFFFNLLAASMALVLTARNGVLFLVAWEAMSLASFFLVVFDDAEPGVGAAGWTYLVATHVGTACLIALFVLLGRAAGTQDFAAFTAPAGSAGGLFLLALVGFGTKAGLFPMHGWLPEAHPAAPSPVSAVMSGVMIKMGVYGIVRLLVVLGAVPAWCAWLVLGLGIVTGIFGILFSLAQRDLKRVLAYSSVENIGILTLGIGFGMLGQQAGRPELAALGYAGALLHALNHALFKGLLFLGAGAVLHAAGTRNLERMGGLLRRMPWTGAACLAGAVAICGLPPFNGFAGEFLIYAGAFRAILGEGALAGAGVAIVLALALIGGLAVAGFTRLAGMAFLGEPRSAEAAAAREVSLAMRWPMAVLAVLCLGIGLAAESAVRFLGPAVELLAGRPGAADSGTVPELARWVTPVSFVATLLIVLALALAIVRRRLLAGRSCRETVTWDCGYAAPAASMQYTATGFAQPLTSGARPLLRTQEVRIPPQGIYPNRAVLATETPDVVQRHGINPFFAKAAGWLRHLRWLQQGRVHVYILYIVVVLMGLLAWALQS